MATDSTLLSGQTTGEADQGAAGTELDFNQVQLAAATPEGTVPVELPRGQQVLIIPVRPGQTIQLPTDSPDGLLAKLGADGNLAIVVDGRTIILQGFLAANDEQPIIIVTNDGDIVDITEVIAGTLPDVALDIQTAAGPAAGPQAGTAGADAAGSGIFVPFAAGPLLGGLDAAGVLGGTQLAYKTIDDTRIIYVTEEGNGLPEDIKIIPDDGQPVAEDGAFLLDEDFLKDGNQDQPAPSPQDDDGKAFASGSVVANFGLDGPRAVDPFLMSPLVGGNGSPSGLFTTDGTPILLFLEPSAGGQQILRGYLTDPGLDTVLLLILDTQTGHFDVILFTSLLHDENSFEDNVALDVEFTAFDATGDEKSAILHLTFDDDMPEITEGQGVFKLAVDETTTTQPIIVDYDDPNFPDDGVQDGSAVEDQILGKLPAELAGYGPALGVAYADASVLFNVQFGADNEALVDGTIIEFAVLEALTNLQDSETKEFITLVDKGNGLVEGQISGGVVVFALTMDANGQVTMAQYRAIDHGDEEPAPGAHDEVAALGTGFLAVTLTATDGDGDQATKTVDIGEAITFDDDGPVFNQWIHFNGELDEGGLDDGIDGGPGDIGGKNVFSTAQFTFDLGNDKDGFLSIADLTVQNGAGQTIDLADLRTADGQAIVIEKSVDAGTGVITWVGVIQDGPKAGDPAFTATLDGAGANIGAFSFTLQAPLEHPFTDDDNKNDGPETSYEDNLQFLFTVAATDSDGDTAYAPPLTVVIDDDSPSISQNYSGAFLLAVDETVDGKGGGDVDANGAGIQDGTAAEGDEVLNAAAVAVAGLDALGTVIGAGTSSVANLFIGAAGADGEKSHSYDLEILNGGLTALRDTATNGLIELIEEDGFVKGVVQGTGELVFALHIDDQTGEVTMAQYRAVNHSDDFPNSYPDEVISLGAELLQVTYSITDNDNDTVSLSKDLGSGITFDDDGPTFVGVDFGDDGDSANGIGLIDEDALDNGNADGPGDDAGGKYVDGVINFDFGSDGASKVGSGPLSIAFFDFTITDSAGNLVPLGSLKTVDGQGLVFIQSNLAGVTTIEAKVLGGPDDGDPVFTFTIDTAGDGIGEFSFELFRALEHPYTDANFKNDGPDTAYEDNLVFDFHVVATDGDGDTAEGHIKIDVDDDSPVVSPVEAPFNLVLDETVADKGTGDVDDPNYSGVLDGTRVEDDEKQETLPASLTIIGPVIGAATADGSALFDVDFGADGGAFSGSKDYELNILNANTGLTDTQTQQAITLHVNGDVIEGRNTNGDVVFALTVDATTGEVSMAQYRAIDHGDQEGEGGAFDEILSLGAFKLALTLTATDADGDKDQYSIDIGGTIAFEDDGPKYLETDFDGEDGDFSGDIGIIDEDALAGGNSGGPGDDAGGTQTDGIIKFDFGSDKAGGMSIGGLSITDSDGNPIALNDLKTADGRAITIAPIAGPDGNGVVTYQAVVAAGEVGAGSSVFTLTLDTAGANLGAFVFTLQQALQHPYTDDDFGNDGEDTAYEDNLLFDFTVIAEDGDGDEATGHIKVSVDDDSPVVSPSTCGTFLLAVDETVDGKGGVDVDANGTNGTQQDGSAAEGDEFLNAAAVLSADLDQFGTAIGAATSNASALFTGTAGADKEGSHSYDLEILNGGLTALVDTETGQTIQLVEEGGYVKGVVDGGATVVFALFINDQTGQVTMAQYRAINHSDDDPNSYPDEVVSLGAGLLQVTYSITDNDDDKTSLSKDLGSAITFDDDGPAAVNDKDSVTEDGATIATGNVVDGKDGGNAGFGTDENGEDGVADAVGSDGFGGITWKDAVNGEIDTTYGKLYVDEDGNYKYVLDNDSDAVQDLKEGETKQEVFTYTIVDGDGDTSTATLTITITGKNDGPIIDFFPEDPEVKNGAAVVSDEGLSGKNEDNDPVPDDETNATVATGTFVVSDPDVGDTLTVELLTTGLPALSFAGQVVTWVPDGPHTLRGQTGGTDAIVIEISTVDGFNYDYEVTLLKPLDHPDDTIEDEVDFNVGVKVTDSQGLSDTAQLNIEIEDDSPKITPGTTGTFLLAVDETVDGKGGVDVDANGTNGTQQDGSAAEGDEVLNAAAVLSADLDQFGTAIGAATSNASTLFTGTAGADQEKSHSYDLEILNGGLTALVDTATGQTIQLVADGDYVKGVVDGGATVVFALFINDQTGQVTMAQYRAINHGTDAPNSYPDEVVSLGSDLLQVTYSITDKDDDTASSSKDLGSAITFDDDGPGTMTAEAAAIVEDEQIAPGIDEPAGVLGDPNPDLGASVTGNVSDNGNWGADGFGRITQVQIGANTAVLVPQGGSVTVYWSQAGVYQGTNATGAAASLLINSTGAYTFTLLDNMLIASGAGELIDSLGTATFTGIDGDGDSANITMALQVKDDIPAFISPDTLHLENKGVAGTGDAKTANLNFVAGADGVGDVVFNVPGVVVGVIPPALGLLAEDSAGNDLKVGGQQLYLYYGGVDGTDTNILVAKTLAGVVGFTITLDPTTGTYIFDQEAAISNGTEVSATDLTGVGGGNPEFKLLINIGGTTQDVAMTTKVGDSINSDNDDIGISQGQTFEAGESIRFDLVNGLKVDGGTAEGYSYDGTHNTTNRWKQLIQITGNKTDNADFLVSAIVADADNQFFGDNETRIDLSVANINIYDDKGALIDPLNWAAAGITVTDKGDSIQITGLLDDYSYEIVTAPADKFTAIQVEAITGTDNFSLGFFSYGENNAGSSIDLSYDIVGTDGDKDSVAGDIDISLYPDATSSGVAPFTGTAGNDTFLGTQGVDNMTGAGGKDLLAGNAGIDTISGGDGDDTIIGGSGNDILSGGNNSDTFVYETLVDGKDSISDFSILAPGSGGDKLDVSQVLDHAGNTWTDGNTVTDAVNGGYLTFTDSGGFVQVNVDIDGSAGAAFAPTAVAVLTNLAFVSAGQAATDLNDNIVVG